MGPRESESRLHLASSRVIVTITSDEFKQSVLYVSLCSTNFTLARQVGWGDKIFARTRMCTAATSPKTSENVRYVIVVSNSETHLLSTKDAGALVQQKTKAFVARHRHQFKYNTYPITHHTPTRFHHVQYGSSLRVGPVKTEGSGAPECGVG